MSDTEHPGCRRFSVTGRVQGVFFRASARDVAIELSLTGYARNMADGSVEVLACGRQDAIEKLAAWLRDGPRMAAVTRVQEEDVEYREFDGFSSA